jgi:hypothetical protein
MARLTGRHRAPTAPRRRAGIEEAVVPNLVSELQHRDDVEHVASLGSCLWGLGTLRASGNKFRAFSVIGTMKSLQLRTTPHWWQLRTDSLVSPNPYLSGFGRGGNLVCNSALAGLDFVHMRTSRQIGKSRVRECLKEGVTRVNLKCWWSSGLFGSVSSRQSSEGGGSNQTHDLDSRDQTRPQFSSVHLDATSKSPQNTSKSSWSRDSKNLSILQPHSKIANRTNQSTS